MKTCTRCKAEKKRTAFSKRLRSPDGLASWCRACFAENHRENRDRYLAKQREYKSARRKQLAREQRERYRRNTEIQAANRRRWRARNLEKAREANRLNAQRRHGPPMSEATKDYLRILRHDPCGYCGASAPSHADHIDAVHTGGASEWTNFTAACPSCNTSKSTKTLLVFLAER